MPATISFSSPFVPPVHHALLPLTMYCSPSGCCCDLTFSHHIPFLSAWRAEQAACWPFMVRDSVLFHAVDTCACISLRRNRVAALPVRSNLSDLPLWRRWRRVSKPSRPLIILYNAGFARKTEKFLRAAYRGAHLLLKVLVAGVRRAHSGRTAICVTANTSCVNPLSVAAQIYSLCLRHRATGATRCCTVQCSAFMTFLQLFTAYWRL